MLQNCMGLINDEAESGSEACVTTLDSGTEEGNIEVEDADFKIGVSDIKIEDTEIKFEGSEVIN